MKLLDSYTVIEIDRNNIFRDAFNSIMTKSPQEYSVLEILVMRIVQNYFFLQLAIPKFR